MKQVAMIGFWVGLVLLSGCSMQKVFNPYESEFPCPQADEGKCQGIPKSYQDSLAMEQGKGGAESAPANIIEKYYGQQVVQSRQAFEIERNKRLIGLIKEAKPPVVIPPEVIRVLILSYTGEDNELFGYRYAYFFATEPKWILSTSNEGLQR